jgi:hypothetical protein
MALRYHRKIVSDQRGNAAGNTVGQANETIPDILGIARQVSWTRAGCHPVICPLNCIIILIITSNIILLAWFDDVGARGNRVTFPILRLPLHHTSCHEANSSIFAYLGPFSFELQTHDSLQIRSRFGGHGVVSPAGIVSSSQRANKIAMQLRGGVAGGLKWGQVQR